MLIVSPSDPSLPGTTAPASCLICSISRFWALTMFSASSFMRWVLALLVGHLRHLYGRLVVRDHGVDERLVEGFPSASCCGSIIMPMPRICSWLISIGTFEVPNSSFFMALSSSISACWVERCSWRAPLSPRARRS